MKIYKHIVVRGVQRKWKNAHRKLEKMFPAKIMETDKKVGRGEFYKVKGKY